MSSPCRFCLLAHSPALLLLFLRRLPENALQTSLSFISHLIMLFVHFPEGILLDFLSSTYLGEPCYHTNSRERVQVIQRSLPFVYSHSKQIGSAFSCAWTNKTHVY